MPAWPPAARATFWPGLVCAFLAQGFSPFEAACKGVYAHALAGDLAKAFVGEYAMGASDILQNLAPALIEMQKGAKEMMNDPFSITYAVLRWW